MQLETGGIRINVQKKKIKTIRLVVSAPDGNVRVSAPLGVSEEQIMEFVESKLEWIRKQQAKFAAMPQQKPPTYVTGEQLRLFGRSYPLRVEEGTKNCFMPLEAEMLLTVRPQSTVEQRERIVNEWYRVQLKQQISHILPYWEARTGLYCTSWQIKNMTTRWGTCNTGTRKLWFSLHLAKQPRACLEYVILHELCHLRVSNHGKAFVALMDEYMPDWRIRKQVLNNVGRVGAP